MSLLSTTIVATTPGSTIATYIAAIEFAAILLLIALTIALLYYRHNYKQLRIPCFKTGPSYTPSATYLHPRDSGKLTRRPLPNIPVITAEANDNNPRIYDRIYDETEPNNDTPHLMET